MSIKDWKIFMGSLNETLNKLKVPTQEKQEVIALIDSLSSVIVE